MNWLDRLTPPGVKKVFGGDKANDTPENLWIKCPRSGDMIYKSDLEANFWVSKAGHHFRIGAKERFNQIFDGRAHERIETPGVIEDPLQFKDDKAYTERLKKARAKTGASDAIALAVGKIKGVETVVVVQDFAFLGGSLGMAAGEAFIKGAEIAVERGLPLVAFTAAGGARMQEGVLSLMQMPRTVIAIQQIKEAGLPYIVVLTDPTTGGVTASYAMLGDIHIAEPGALVAFTGPRVIEQTIREKLPEGFQRAEFLKEKGMVDMVVERPQLAAVLGRMLAMIRDAKAGGGKAARAKASLKAEAESDAPLLNAERVERPASLATPASSVRDI